MTIQDAHALVRDMDGAIISQPLELALARADQCIADAIRSGWPGAQIKFPHNKTALRLRSAVAQELYKRGFIVHCWEKAGRYLGTSCNPTYEMAELYLNVSGW